MKPKASTSSPTQAELVLRATLPHGELSFVLQKILVHGKTLPYVTRRETHAARGLTNHEIHHHPRDISEQHVLIQNDNELQSWLDADPQRFNSPATFNKLQSACKAILLGFSK